MREKERGRERVGEIEQFSGPGTLLFELLEFFGATRQKILAPPGRSGAFGACTLALLTLLGAARVRESAEVRNSL